MILLSLAMLLCACGRQKIDSEELKNLTDAIKTANSFSSASGKYMIEISFSDNVTLYYAAGDAAWDKEAVKSHAVFSQTYLGSSSEGANYFKNDRVLSVSGEDSVEVERSADELFALFPYANVFEVPSEPQSLEISQSTLGKTYTVVMNDTESICNSVVGGDIFTIVDVIKKPQPDKTKYGAVTCTYTVDDGCVIAARYEFDVTLYDTPAYVPGYSVPEDEYSITLHVVARISYDGFGEGVEIHEYSAEESSEISS